MKRLNLRDDERNNVFVDFNVNRFVATVGEDGMLVGKYSSQKAMNDDFLANNIAVKSISSLAYTMAISGYGN